MWSGAANAIPTGWLLCDGSNGTPDLRNRFIVGAGSSYSVGNTGGSDSVTLTTAQIPSHNHGHSLSAASGGAHTHSLSSISVSGTTGRESWVDSDALGLRNQSRYEFNYWSALNFSSPGSCNALSALSNSVGNGLGHTHSFSASLSGTTASSGAHTHSLSGSISNTGSGNSHENRPPYYALCFIMKA